MVEKNVLDKKNLDKVQKIVDMSLSGETDRNISKKLGIALNQVASMRLFFGIRKSTSAIDLKTDYKVVPQTGQVSFNLNQFTNEFGLTRYKKYKFKAISQDNDEKTLTLKFEEIE